MTIEECKERKEISVRMLTELNDEHWPFEAESDKDKECVKIALRRSIAIDELNIAELSKKDAQNPCNLKSACNAELRFTGQSVNIAGQSTISTRRTT